MLFQLFWIGPLKEAFPVESTWKLAPLQLKTVKSAIENRKFYQRYSQKDIACRFLNVKHSSPTFYLISFELPEQLAMRWLYWKSSVCMKKSNIYMQTKNCNKNIHKKKFKHHCMLIGLCSTLLSNIIFDADWLTDWKKTQFFSNPKSIGNFIPKLPDRSQCQWACPIRR